jgi:DNA polymerase type B, organellar and viral
LIGKPGGTLWDMQQADVEWIGERFIAVNSELAERERKRREKARIRAARQKVKYPNRSHHGKDDSIKGRERLRSQKVFIVWDGEGPQDTGYSLFGNSEGMEVCKPGLSTLECLNLIIETEQKFPDAIHVWYGGNYDVSNILKDLPWRHLSQLAKFTRCVWRDWQFEYIPHKWFKVRHGMVNATIYDVVSFFGCALVTALEKWEIGPWKNVPARGVETIKDGTSPSVITTPNAQLPSIETLRKMTERQIVEVFKQRRSTFTWSEIQQIAIYMRLELKYTKLLMEKLREAFEVASYVPLSWHGPGALAREALKRHKVYDAMAETPPEVRIASRYAYFGGRFSLHLAGHFHSTIYAADRNSAYPYACTLLPNLQKGKWRRVSTFEPGKYGVYHIAYQYPIDCLTSSADGYRIYPLPKRLSHGGVCFPYNVTGWYWSPEAEMVSNDPNAVISEGWVFDEDDPTDRPFAWMHEYYRRRRILKQQGKAAEYTFKLIINAVYGQLAQRAGWDRRHNAAPRSHQLEWAGFVTSHCRAAMWTLADQCERVKPGSVISIDTDGIMATVPIPIPDDEIGTELGQYTTEEWDEGVIWQSGMYALKEQGEWTKGKTRGIARGTFDPASLVKAVQDGKQYITITRHKFVGFGLALAQDLSLVNTWVDEDIEYKLGGPEHNDVLCPQNPACHDGIHRLWKINPSDNPRLFRQQHSEPHYLPWLAAKEEMRNQKMIMDSLTLFDISDNDEWINNV